MKDERTESELLAVCAQEPIHVPGLIQPHGILLALNEGTMVVEQASENAAEAFPRAGPSVLGKTLGGVFGAEEAHVLVEAMARQLSNPRSTLLGTVRSGMGTTFDVLGHQHKSLVILEMELSPPDLEVRQSPYQVNQILEKMKMAKTPEQMYQATASGVRSLTGFDKVMVYCFDAEWNGTVVAESQNGEMEAFLGHRFPASDIPAQARELYRLNPTRITCDVSAVAVPVLPAVNKRTGQPLDMTYAALRSVSPVHIRYL